MKVPIFKFDSRGPLYIQELVSVTVAAMRKEDYPMVQWMVVGFYSNDVQKEIEEHLEIARKRLKNFELSGEKFEVIAPQKLERESVLVVKRSVI